MVGPIRVLMFICFSSSAHIVRHLKRVSGSFCKANKHIPYSPFHFIKMHSLFSVIWMLMAHTVMDAHMNKVSNNEISQQNAQASLNQVCHSNFSSWVTYRQIWSQVGCTSKTIASHPMMYKNGGKFNEKPKSPHVKSVWQFIKKIMEDKSCLYDSACWDLKILKYWNYKLCN